MQSAAAIYNVYPAYLLIVYHKKILSCSDYLWTCRDSGYDTKGNLRDSSQFILQPQHTDNPQNTCEGMGVPYYTFEVHL